MVREVTPATSSLDIVDMDAYFANPRIENLDLLIELVAQMIQQANVDRNQARELNKEQFHTQMKAASHPKNAAIASLTFTILSAAITVAGAVVANNTELGTKVGQSLYRIFPNASAKVFGSTLNVTSFSKTWESGATAMAKTLSGGADASSSIGNSLSQRDQADSTRLQHVYGNTAEDRRRSMEEAQRLISDMAKILEARASAARAVSGR